MTSRKILYSAAASLTVLFTSTAAAPGNIPDLAAVDQLNKGGWTLTVRDGRLPDRKICLGDPKMLLQVEHGNANCSYYVIANTPDRLRVSYKCGSLGNGVTEVRRESNSLVQVESQGIVNGSPFAFNAEARHSGAC